MVVLPGINREGPLFFAKKHKWLNHASYIVLYQIRESVSASKNQRSKKSENESTAI